MADASGLAPRSLALYLVYRDVSLLSDWLVRTLGFVEKGRFVNADGVATNAELAAGKTAVLLERGDHPPDAYPHGTRWTGVWVDDPDACYRKLMATNIDVSPPEDEPWGVRLVRVVRRGTFGRSSGGRPEPSGTENEVSY